MAATVKIACALSLALCSVSSLNVSAGAGDRAQAALRIAGSMFAVSVGDLDASARWYSETFGLKIVDRQRTPDNTGIALLQGGGLIVELIQHAKAAGRPESARQDPVLLRGFFKVGLIVEDFDATLAALKKRGVQIAFGPYPARPNQPANAIIRDNEGNLIQLFAR